MPTPIQIAVLAAAAVVAVLIVGTVVLAIVGQARCGNPNPINVLKGGCSSGGGGGSGGNGGQQNGPPPPNGCVTGGGPTTCQLDTTQGMWTGGFSVVNNSAGPVDLADLNLPQLPDAAGPYSSVIIAGSTPANSCRYFNTSEFGSPFPNPGFSYPPLVPAIGDPITVLQAGQGSPSVAITSPFSVITVNADSTLSIK